MTDTNEKICFVIAPIGKSGSDIRKRSDQVLKHIIRPAVESCGYKAVRADEIAEPGIITNQIIRHVVEDPLVIADLTGQNANVFYELAIRHAVRKPLVQIIDKVEDIPFDVGLMRTIQVDHRDLDSVEETKAEIKKQIQSLEESSSSLENPISVAIEDRSIGVIEKDRDKVDGIKQPRSTILVVIFLFLFLCIVGIGFTQFQEIEKKQHEIAEILLLMTAKDVADDSVETNQAAVNVGENPRASLIDKAIAQAVFLQQENKKDEAIEKWRAVAQIAEGIDNDQAARAWFSVGYLLVENKNWEDSISAYDQAISLKPDFVAAYNNRGNVKGALGRRIEAIADFDEAIRLKPDHAVAYYNRGHTKDELGRHEDAIADFDEAIRLKPDYAEAYSNRGVAKAELGQHNEAIANYDEAIRLKPDLAEAYSNRGNAKIALRQHNEAIADYDKAIRLKPDLAEAYSNRGVAKAELGQHNEAIADYDKAIQLKQNYADAYNNRGNAKALLERYVDAIADYDVATRLNPDYVEAYNARGTAKVKLKRYADAIADFDEAIRLQPDYVEAYNARGTAKAELKQYEKAIADYDKAIQLKQNYADAYNNRGAAKADLERYEDAIADYDEAIHRQPDYAEAYYNRGVAKGALGRIHEARQDFEKARDLARDVGNDSLAGFAGQRLRSLDSQEDE